jgi:hypothetical protein
MIVGYTKQNMGGVDLFRTFYHQPLNKDVWYNLFHRLCIKGLRIYKPEDAEWLDGRGPDEMTIRLDEDGKIRSIYYIPSHLDYEHPYETKDLVDAIGCLLEMVNGKIVSEDNFKKAEDAYDYWITRYNTPPRIIEKIGFGIINTEILGNS